MTFQRWRWELCLDLLFNLDSGGKALRPVLGSRQHRCWSHREVAPGAVAGRVKEYQQVEICDKWKSESRKWSSDDWYYFLLLVHDMAHMVTFFCWPIWWPFFCWPTWWHTWSTLDLLLSYSLGTVWHDLVSKHVLKIPMLVANFRNRVSPTFFYWRDQSSGLMVPSKPGREWANYPFSLVCSDSALLFRTRFYFIF